MGLTLDIPRQAFPKFSFMEKRTKIFHIIFENENKEAVGISQKLLQFGHLWSKNSRNIRNTFVTFVVFKNICLFIVRFLAQPQRYSVEPKSSVKPCLGNTALDSTEHSTKIIPIFRIIVITKSFICLLNI